MKKNVLVITGSPRKGGNTDLLAQAFAKGAEAAGHEVTIFNAAADPVQPCRACDGCWSKGAACVFEDGFTRLAPLMLKADAIALCGPVYWFSFSAQLKSVIDKIYSLSGESSPQKLKGTMYLLMCAGEPTVEIFDLAKQEFDNTVSFLGLVNGGYVLAPGVYEKGDINNTDALDRAEKLGRQVA